MKNILILLCVFMPILVIAEVNMDPYGYWHTELTVQERYELDLLLAQYYSNHLDEPGKPKKRHGKNWLHGDCYNNQSLANRELQQP